jgi:hypothetical protein
METTHDDKFWSKYFIGKNLLRDLDMDREEK